MTTLLKPLIKVALVGAVVWLVTACVSTPVGVTTVQNFDAQRYLGKWYEIARLDNRFEHGLEQISAEYSFRPDGQLKVLNRGFNTSTQQWSQIEGRAKFVSSPTVGALKVSFFGPFYAGYNIVELDPDYQYALVVGNNFKYLWILSRTPELAPPIKTRLVAKARALGFATDQLIWVKH
jgi:apolipoprotein D and lipocalin family protein